MEDPTTQKVCFDVAVEAREGTKVKIIIVTNDLLYMIDQLKLLFFLVHFFILEISRLHL